jgi:hypothetical protein
MPPRKLAVAPVKKIHPRPRGMISYLWPEAMPSLTFVGEERDPSDGDIGPDLVFATQDRYITATALSDDE